MVLIYGGVLVTESEVPAVTEAARTFQAACRAEQGCIDYILSWDIAQPNRIRLVEAWESEDDHKVHSGQPHVEEWTAFVKAASAEPPAFHRHGFAG